MDMKFWRNWICLWAVMPVFAAFFQMANNRFWNDTVQIETHHTWGITFVFFASAILYLVAPLLVLRRHFPKYGKGAHCLGLLGAFTCLLGLFCIAAFWLPEASLFQFEQDFSLAVLRSKQDAPVLFRDILGLPWGPMLLQEMVTASAAAAGPVLVICAAAGQLKKFPKTMLFVLLAFAACVISNGLFDIARSDRTALDTLNGRAWLERLAIIGSWSVSSMIGASISAIGIGGLLERPELEETAAERSVLVAGSRLAGISALALWSGSFGLLYALSPSGLANDLAEFRKSFTAPPETDVSFGEDILRFSHVMDANTFGYANREYVDLQLSPDGVSAVFVEAHGQNGGRLAAFDVATGERLADLSEPLSQHERVSYLWTKDQRHLVVRSRGEPTLVGRYRRYETQLSVFSLPDYQPVAEWQSDRVSCQNPSTSLVNMAEDDHGNLVVLCLAPSAEDEGRPMTVNLSIPHLSQRGLRAFETDVTDGHVRRLIELDGEVYAARMSRQNAPRVILENVVWQERSIILETPYASDRGGELTFQGFVQDRLVEGVIGMRLCGETDGVSNPPAVATQTAWGPSFCRVVDFDLSSGLYVGHSDGAETRGRRDNSVPRSVSIAYGPWEFAGEVDRASLSGPLSVRDVTSGTVVQTLESSTQIPVFASQEHGLLFTHRVDAREIAVYRIAE